jgi:hypothetical protein
MLRLPVGSGEIAPGRNEFARSQSSIMAVDPPVGDVGHGARRNSGGLGQRPHRLGEEGDVLRKGHALEREHVARE